MLILDMLIRHWAESLIADFAVITILLVVVVALVGMAIGRRKR